MVTGAALDKGADSHQLQAVYAQALMLEGRIDDGTVVARPLFLDHSADPVTRTSAACSLVAGGSAVGRADDCENVMGQSLQLAESARAAMPWGLGTVMVAAVIALAGAGRLEEAAQISEQIYHRALADDDEWLRPRGACAPCRTIWPGSTASSVSPAAATCPMHSPATSGKPLGVQDTGSQRARVADSMERGPSRGGEYLRLQALGVAAGDGADVPTR
jgi:hypothetical protein